VTTFVSFGWLFPSVDQKVTPWPRSTATDLQAMEIIVAKVKESDGVVFAG